jgi:hypothetical protein
MPLWDWHKIFWIVALCFLTGLMLVLGDGSAAIAEQSQEQKARQRMLNQEAANALWRFQYALKKEGFYSGRVRLNVWRAAAIDAGKFDPQKYEEFKKQLYEKSLNESLKCFEYYLEQGSHHDADMCLQTWKMHAKEIDRFDESTYQEFVERLKSMKETPDIKKK